MSTSAIPAATNYLLGLARQSVTGIAGAVVSDGWSDEPAATMFGIGASAPPFFEAETTAVEGLPSWAALGAGHVNEDFTIPCYIYVGVGGASNATVRGAAFVIWDRFYPLFLADITLGGALKAGRDAEISRFAARGPQTPEEASGGRFCLIQFDTHCMNLY